MPKVMLGISSVWRESLVLCYLFFVVALSNTVVSTCVSSRFVDTLVLAELLPFLLGALVNVFASGCPRESAVTGRGLLYG